MSLKWIDYGQGQNIFSWIYSRQLALSPIRGNVKLCWFVLSLPETLTSQVCQSTVDFIYKRNTVRSHHTHQVMLDWVESCATVMTIPADKQQKCEHIKVFTERKACYSMLHARLQSQHFAKRQWHLLIEINRDKGAAVSCKLPLTLYAGSSSPVCGLCLFIITDMLILSFLIFCHLMTSSLKMASCVPVFLRMNKELFKMMFKAYKPAMDRPSYH